MNTKYKEIQNKFEQLEADLQNPAVLSDSKKVKETSQEYTDLKPTVEKIRELGAVENSIAETQSMINQNEDAQLKEMATAELPDLEAKRIAMEKALDEMTRPQDPFDKKDVIVEIRAGVCGD